MVKESPLTGLKVLELGTLVAAPFATRLLAEFGAEVIKVEAPGTGDPIRNWRIVENGTSLWWYVQSRNKKSITLDLRTEEGQEIVRKLVSRVDVVIENFRPGTLEKWNIGYEQLKKINPRLIMVRISGFGQTGPYRNKPGFGSIGEAMGGLRYITGYPDRPPTRVGISLGDSLAGMYAAMAALMAIYHRDVKGTGVGQVIDVALYEAVFSLMESMVPEYDRKGVIRERTGSVLPGIAPSNTYLCSDGKYVVIGGNGDAIFARLMDAIGRPELKDDERFSSNSKRAEHMEFLDKIIGDWTKQHTLQDVIRILDEAGVPAGPIYSIEDIMQDPQFLEREMIQSFHVDGLGELKLPGIVPKFSETPGVVKWVGPKLGEHNEEVYGEIGLDKETIKKLKEKGII
ncbi:CaiB/BaiF CoA transferase family protein [Parageobacillus thermoglucosidasius]|jgi:crotonobetainyl-CoA:carnitine CoA-transferase CaiB-like acyl-CoA transferase|uniref:Carnitine dehydratase n=1 Tax=Parageobacillus thermoglucosidasius TaxID=1426 RepID=A0A1B7KVE7_PARTM|nr:CaiB/BaiF CoA-transferase family protein [Parageobacillus thermoglucosidasius]OAT74068.1 carnitine dehydratase [Parageobacillus thermoglucosidasius]